MDLQATFMARHLSYYPLPKPPMALRSFPLEDVPIPTGDEDGEDPEEFPLEEPVDQTTTDPTSPFKAPQ
ncbi:hypothetical protein RJT34_16484 [Clitoria ternatea]|uniref:Uncharacterized protein n=1 Tax=Clitoria ternatea TaxID=43366 RepID=A0AAN9PDP6_CLITE